MRQRVGAETYRRRFAGGAVRDGVAATKSELAERMAELSRSRIASPDHHRLLARRQFDDPEPLVPRRRVQGLWDRSVAHASVVLGQQVPGEVAAQVAPHGVDVIGPVPSLSMNLSTERFRSGSLDDAGRICLLCRRRRTSAVRRGVSVAGIASSPRSRWRRPRRADRRRSAAQCAGRPIPGPRRKLQLYVQ